VQLAQIAAGVLGVLLITSETAHFHHLTDSFVVPFSV
jgi:hypothetical protein